MTPTTRRVLVPPIPILTGPAVRLFLTSMALLFVELLVIRWKGYPHWVLPALGGSLAVVLSTLWLTSAFWYFTNVRFGF